MKILFQFLKYIATVLVVVGIFVGSIFGITRFLAYRNTVYAEHFNQGSFESIWVGTSAEDVRNALGQPLSVSSNDAGFEYHRYSWRKKDGDYYMKVIIYQNGRVVDKHESYYID